MIYDVPFRADKQNREIFSSNLEEFPFVCYHRDMDNYTKQGIAWHWHSAFEIGYVEEGAIEYRDMDCSFTIEKGNLIFLNSNILHTVSVKKEFPGCRIYAHLFEPSFLAGTYNSVLAQKYLLPVVKNAGFSMMEISPTDLRKATIVQKFMKIVELSREEPFGYEMEIRNELSGLWLLFLKELEEQHPRKMRKNIQDEQRMKKMLDFIHRHYGEHLTLEEIAAVADISPRECTRCFQRSIQISPFGYLNRHRIYMAAEMLLNTTDTILTISENCGFSSGSYFGKTFLGIMGCTPNQFRKW